MHPTQELLVDKVWNTCHSGVWMHAARRSCRSTLSVLTSQANMLTLSAPEMSVLLAGLRVLGANAGGSDAGVLTAQPGAPATSVLMQLSTARVLFCIDADLCNQILIFQYFSKSARILHLCTA